MPCAGHRPATIFNGSRPAQDMLFNSIDFAVFLPIVFLVYWCVGGTDATRRNWVVLLASTVFYGWWDWRYLGLLGVSICVDYMVGGAMGRSTVPRQRKALLGVSLLVNLGLLGFLKYFDFFTRSFAEAFTLFGASIQPSRLDLVLPIGISFYTFQTLSYSIDVYRKQLQPSRDPVAFAAYVSFFPQLVAGPIERAVNLLPQFATKRSFDLRMAVDGSRQMLWGFFKKLVIADNCAIEVDRIFGQYESAGASTLVLGAVLFAFQIYGDFSGYSDIAIGCARLLGFRLMRNFAFPYFSRDIAEFWRRWHISLSTWFRDYVYVPLGGSRGGKWLSMRNVFIIFLVSGFWHGANWTFVCWGLLNAIFFLPLMLRGANRDHLEIVAAGRWLPSLGDAFRMLGTFLLTCLAWVFFRARSVGQAFDYIGNMWDPSILSVPEMEMVALPGLILLFLAVEWIGREGQHALERIDVIRPRIMRWSVYAVLVSVIGLFMATEETPFIYFRF
jgi:D-alanyl-lipoteichoic acid acyltransferase DltB (MBOAT superfamily)